ncbi:uncharacterized protein YqhQ [Lederbergia galactosidilyticus]|uniref:DUF1385 domain-containing protein n=1 Tax=Lederbergia galactosidilytica TaxID=217031 RepID=UPI001AEB66DB|nr:DUF1385 domain-containing protein [Lederbergia galactosidilytica]MBP1917526.1 uncharacterized protein YqhQ [Lederbergia galactosidilytica]
MKILAGRAGFNFVSFTGERYQSISRFKDGKITAEIRLKKENKKIVVALSKIPFVRSFAMIFDLMIEFWRRFLFAIIVLFLMEILIISKLNYHFIFTIPIINFPTMMFGFLVIASLIIKNTSIGRYHAAEHMVANAYGKGHNLTLEKVKKQPRTHNDCGTNLVVSVFICFYLLSMILGDTFWLFLVSWSIGFELWRSEPKGIWNLVRLVGKATQYLLFTSMPREKHLIVAIEAIRKLEEKELANNQNH